MTSCPFCGGSEIGLWLKERMTYAFCRGCGARGPLTLVGIGAWVNSGTGNCYLAQLPCETWNRRVGPGQFLPPTTEVAVCMSDRHAKRERP